MEERMAKKLTTGNTTASANTETTPELASQLTIDALTPIETMIEYDSAGKTLLFDGKDNFRVLDEAVLRQLSKDNNMRYRFAKEFHDSRANQSEFASKINVDLQLVSKPAQKLDFVARKGMTGRWVRPEMIRDRMAKGWKIADAKTDAYLPMEGGVHRISRNGQDELILMEKPTAEVKKIAFANAARNTKMAGIRSRVVTGEAAQAGIQEYDESQDRAKRDWHVEETVENTEKE
jgi:hypothetical protein